MNIEAVIREMTLEEKFRFLTGGGLNHTSPVERLAIPSMRLQDGPFGLRMKTQDQQSGTADRIRSAFPNCHEGAEVVSTAFPSGAAMGAAWDPELVQEIGAAIGEECRAYGVRAILGPAMNLKRHPLCGRNFEYFSEDPILTKQLASAYVQGVQSQGVAACPKHFAMNNQERDRFYVSSEVDGRTMRELYLRPFETVVKHTKPWSIMCTYNRVNGVLCSEHHQLLQEILRQEWGFDGIVVSDWGSVRNRAYSLLASVDLCMPYQEEALDQLREAYENHLIDDETVNEAVRRMLVFCRRTAQEQPPQVCDFEAHDHLALQAARESIVLLKNDNHTLPLQPEKLKKLLVAGETAARPYIGGDGSSRVANPYRVTVPLEELQKCLGGNVEVEFLGDAQLYTYENEIGLMEGLVCRKAMEADAVVIFASQDYSCYSETMDRPGVELPPYQEHVIRASHRAGKPVIVVLNVGSAVSTCSWNREADAILVSWLGGQAMGRAVAETLCGQNNPSGKLAETFPRRLSDAPAVADYPGDGYKTVYREGSLIGYRHYDQYRIRPDYAFGFGLSYTHFSYDNLTLEANRLCFELTNDGGMDGDEIAQVYVCFPSNSWLTHPPKELKAFRRVHLKVGEKKRVEIPVTEDFFCYYNPALHRWTTEAGTYTILVGGSSDRLPLCVETECSGPAQITTW